MPHRRSASPTGSEVGFDISTSLLPDVGAELNGEIDDLSAWTAKNGTLDAGVESEEDDETFIAAQQAASNRKNGPATGKNVKKGGGGFQAMGLNGVLLKAITRKGFAVPTPIQRKTIPLILERRDVVGMARTGSGKTAAFVIPMIEKLKAHNVKVGARAIVLSPSRELALQTLKAIKEFGRGTDLRTVLLVGGENFEEQFSQMASNPDIIIATPGRFLHLMVEMRLDLSTVRFAVFDEADRLFEMGFSVQLTEILHALPPSRQTLLFSATLPKSLVEFAKAGLQDPTLIRLDADSKISPDLESAFLALKSAQKEGALLHLLHDVIKMPVQTAESSAVGSGKDFSNGKKRKRQLTSAGSQDSPTSHSTIIFAATKHHVEYLSNLLRAAGFAVSYVYGSLDQTARHMQVENFRAGTTNILVVTDVAARGIDIPLLANVVNYDFPPQPKIYVHRVGRTARAGKKGWSYSFVQDADVPYLLDLQLFLGKKLVTGWSHGDKANFAEDIVLGAIPPAGLERNCEAVSKLLDEDEDLLGLRLVASKGEKLYMRTRNSASTESAKRSKKLSADQAISEPNMLYNDRKDNAQLQKEEMLAKISGFRPAETVFEIGKRGTVNETADLVRRRREKLRLSKAKLPDINDSHEKENEANVPQEPDAMDEEIDDVESDGGLEVTFPDQQQSNGNATEKGAWQDPEFFISYQPKHANFAEERGYGVHSGSNSTFRGSNFADAARNVTMDLNNDESKAFGEPSKVNQMRWDKGSKKYVSRANDEDGSKGKKLVRGESGQKIAASFRSGRFDAWKKQNRVNHMPKTGEAEATRPSNRPRHTKGFKHFAERAPKQPDKYRDDYYKKKKQWDERRNNSSAVPDPSKVKNELRSAEDVRKQRKLQERRKDKNARPSRKRKM